MYAKQNKDGTVSINVTEKLEGFVSVLEIPTFSRNWRNAWVLEGDKVVIDLEKAKNLQRQLAIDIAPLRVSKDIRGSVNLEELAMVDKEIESINWGSAATLDELYNMWPKSIETRHKTRQYK